MLHARRFQIWEYMCESMLHTGTYSIGCFTTSSRALPIPIVHPTFPFLALLFCALLVTHCPLAPTHHTNVCARIYQSNSVCVTCPLNSYCNLASTSPIACPGGSYANTPTNPPSPPPVSASAFLPSSLPSLPLFLPPCLPACLPVPACIPPSLPPSRPLPPKASFGPRVNCQPLSYKVSADDRDSASFEAREQPAPLLTGHLAVSAVQTVSTIAETAEMMTLPFRPGPREPKRSELPAETAETVRRALGPRAG